MEKRVSSAVVRRLPRYYRHLTELQESGVSRISSGSLAAKMGLTASQVRQDFNCFGGFGQQGYGYNVEALKNSIASILHLDQGHTAIMIGAGNLGRALMNNFNFAGSGIRLVAGFDIAPELVGSSVAGVPIHDISGLEGYIQEHRPDVAVLTLPKAWAREMAERVCKCGIRGIWNFTNIDLHLDVQEVPVENVHFSESLMVLSYKLQRESPKED